MNKPVASPLPVGEILAAVLEDRGWTQSDFASVLGRPTQFVSEIVNGKKEITRESAAQIGAALNQTPGFWLDLQDQHLLHRQASSWKAQHDLSEVRRRARLRDLVPVSVLRKRNILTSTTLDDLEAEVVELLELDHIDDEPTFTIAARRGNRDEPVSPLQKAWVACVRREARKRLPDVGRFSKPRLRRLAEELPAMLNTPEGFADLPERFAAVGVVLIHVEALPGAKIDGCAFTIGRTPVLAVSGPWKLLDRVMWAVLHEGAHILLSHVTDEVVVEALDDPEADGTDDEEDEANRTAGSWLLPEPMPTPPGRVSADWVEMVARERGLAPIVIVGQLQYHGVLDWRTTLARHAPNVTEVLARW